MFDFALHPPEFAMEHLAESRYGFSFIDMGLTPQDLADFDQIEIVKKQDYSRCGELSKVEGEVAVFLSQIGNSDPGVVRRVAVRIGQIAHRVLSASGKETGWVCLRASIPAKEEGELHWHFDWPFYISEAPQHRFVMALKGAQTLFYPLPLENTELRKRIWRQMNNLDFMTKTCDVKQALSPPRGAGVLFINRLKGALHSEPISGDPSRLFLSIVPCSEEDLPEMASRIERSFQLK